eukprot:CAMPEP_0204873292 /NCGR_PEP_ID=MMETSP1348-20121228/40256_1 /ASSEMBLY_ACC=CAM_ASM_000700 /TAXON_ID=215587 /ORGANISM="Aplanochytrium stocchinoi, Strain GSBS06" /LENGTH=339 /DNA_ID=CAMNT_0052028553 /DNA_START=824 /DNA_END=1840 /DNA_ORIENTATION=-
MQESLPKSFVEGKDAEVGGSFKEGQKVFNLSSGDSFEAQLVQMLQRTTSSISIGSTRTENNNHIDEASSTLSSSTRISAKENNNRYAVFHFLQSEQRDISMLLVRFVIAWQRFLKEFVYRSISTQIVRLVHQTEPTRVIDLSSFQNMVKAQMAELFQEELITFTSLGDNAYFDIDYYFTLDADWSWRHWSCLSISNYYHIQRNAEREKMNSLAWKILATYAINSLLEVAAENDIAIIWRDHNREPRLESSESGIMTRPFQETLREVTSCSDSQGRANLVSKYCGEFYVLGSKHIFDELVQQSYQLDSLGQNKDLLMDILGPVIDFADRVDKGYQDILTW